jgi:hypothetical protein
MHKATHTLLLALVVSATSEAWAQEFPAAPPDIPAAEAAGLRRIGAAELKRDYPPKRIARNLRGQTVHTELKADGTLEYADDTGLTDTGSWSLSERNGGMICRAYSKQMGRRFCAIYYAAPDGIHYFGYNPEDKAWRATTRREE